MIEFEPSTALAATVLVALLIVVAFVAYKRGYSEGAKAGRAYERKYGKDGIRPDFGDEGKQDN